MKSNEEIDNYISTIKSNWPSEPYSKIREALIYAIKLMENEKTKNESEKVAE